MIFLGKQFDSVNMSISIPADKLTEIRQIIAITALDINFVQQALGTLLVYQLYQVISSRVV
jgi:hypothetical protein